MKPVNKTPPGTSGCVCPAATLDMMPWSVVNHIDNHPAATRDLRQAIVVDNSVQLGGNMNINRLTFIGCLSFLILGVTVVCTAASSPIATIKGPFEQIIGILNAPQFKAPEKRASQRNNIWQIARTMFDADALSERVVGKRWATFTAAEKSRFADIFVRFLGAIYIEKMQGEHSNFMINFDKELIKGDRALVRTKVIRESLEIAIDYRMKQTNGQWKIYDVLVENGISLVSNFRVQFSSILQKESPAQLIQRLEQKLADQQQAVACD